MQTVVPIVVAVVTAIAGVTTWFLQKSRERRDTIAKRKSELYESLLTSVIHLTSADATPFFVESQFAWLYASDDVLSEIHAYCSALARKDASNQELQEILGRLLLGMRKDIGVSSTIDIEWVKTKFRAVTARRDELEAYLARRASTAVSKPKADTK